MGTVVENVKTGFEKREDTSICIPEFK